MTDDLTTRREAEALDLWRSEGKAPAGICPHCGSVVSVVQRDERFIARCSHRRCGACGPQHYRLTSAVEAFCRPPAYVLRHMAVHPSSLTDVVTTLEAERDAARAEVDRLRGIVEAMNPEHNYMALLDLYMERAGTAEAEVRRLRTDLARLTEQAGEDLCAE